MDDRQIEAELIALKDAALAATARADADFYRDYLSDDARAVIPAGVFSKAAIVRAMGGGGGFRSEKVEDVRAVALAADVGLVTYRATFSSSGEMFVTTIYRRCEGKWKGVFYQQTPLGRVSPPTAGERLK